MRITTGDAIEKPFTLTKGGTAIAIDSGATVRGAIVDMQDEILIAGPVTIVSTDAGNDWPNGRVVFKMNGATTATIQNAGTYTIEIEVNDPAINSDGPQTWHINGYEVVKGLIT